MPPPAKVPPTEALHPRSEDLDLRSPLSIVALLHREDRRAVRAVGKVLPDVARAAQLAAEALAQGGRLIYAGAGTSGRLAVLDAAECPPTFGTRPSQVRALLAGGRRAVTRAVEGAEDDAAAGAREVRRARVGPLDLVVGITASAGTPYVTGALAEARRRGARTGLITSHPRPKQRAEVDVCIAADTGPELLAGSTRLKAGTAAKLILNALSTAAMIALGKVHRGRMVDLKATNRKLRARAERMVAELTGLPLPRAQALLEQARGHPRLALAIHYTGLPPAAAARAARARGLRRLEPGHPRRK